MNDIFIISVHVISAGCSIAAQVVVHVKIAPVGSNNRRSPRTLIGIGLARADFFRIFCHNTESCASILFIVEI
ncbi:MAG: hypothetical protein L0229_04275 [Blastocatellia bacterium]|nr:hypothetical protein [Blastocatellia bacterium]